MISNMRSHIRIDSPGDSRRLQESPGTLQGDSRETPGVIRSPQEFSGVPKSPQESSEHHRINLSPAIGTNACQGAEIFQQVIQVTVAKTVGAEFRHERALLVNDLSKVCLPVALQSFASISNLY